jgi:hypothetical protein
MAFMLAAMVVVAVVVAVAVAVQALCVGLLLLVNKGAAFNPILVQVIHLVDCTERVKKVCSPECLT